MSQEVRISLEALELLAALKELDYSLDFPHRVGQLGMELIDAGFAGVHEQAGTLLHHEPLTPNIFPMIYMPVVINKYFLRATGQGEGYLAEHREDLETLTLIE